MDLKTIKREKNKFKKIDIDLEKTIKEKKIITRLIKRMSDIFIGIIGIIILIPMTIVIYIVRKILKEDDGPIFYEQLRIGKNGKHFRLYKYRTMIVGADEKLKQYLEENEEARKEFEENHKLQNDPRITKLGKFLRKTSIDEVPQFINVLMGSMSLIGPRPYLLSEKEDMGIYYDKIIKCKPGITGLWQTSGRSQTTFEERLKIESYYADNNSIITDAKIFFKTIRVIFKKEGAI